MTRFSIVVPAWQVVEFVDECLQSVRSQKHVDLEVIVVDDGSSDGTGTVIDRHAAEDERLRAIHLSRRSGVGAARNLGISEATGDYVVLLDADDTLFDSMVLAELSKSLAAYDEPDILFFDYEYRRPCGLRRLSNLTRCLDDVPGVSGARSRPALLEVSWVSWNKVYRRRFVGQLDVEFPPGIYEDFVWSICTVLAAQRVAVLRAPCVRYRCCRPQSISRAPGVQHFDVFDQFRRIMDFLDRHPECDFAEARSIISKSFRHFLLDRVERKKVIPEEAVPAFLRRIHDLVGR